MSINPSTVTYPLVKDLVNPTEAEIDQAVKVLVDAFDTDPFSLILLGGNLELAHIELLANVRAALLGGQVHVITIGPDPADIVGVAIWYPPGSSVFSTEEQRALGWNQFLETIPESLRRWWTEYFGPTVGKVSADALGPDYSRDSWHLHLFGVMKAYQQKGYGKAVFQLAQQRSIAERKPMILETTNDVDITIYKKLGFKIVSSTVITSPIADAHLWVMIKEPSS